MAKLIYSDLSKDIIENIGGEENVKDLRHCTTRLRFHLKNENKANDEAIKNLDGVVSVVKASGQYQVVIGQEVGEVYQEIMKQTDIPDDNIQIDADSTDTNDEKPKGNLVDRFIDFISSIFQPFLFALTATGMIKGVVALLGAFGLTTDNSGLVFVLNAAGDAFFQFLPVMVGITAARKFKINEFTALAIVVGFLHPSIRDIATGDVQLVLFEGTAFQLDSYFNVLGIPVLLPGGGYYSSIIPIIASVWFGAKLEKWIKSWMPKLVSSFLTPFLTIIIAFPIALLVIGPVTNFLSDLVGLGFTTLNNVSPILAAVVLAVAWQILVIFGLHWGILPIMFVLLAETGINSISPATQLSTFGSLGVLLALSIKAKETKVKQLAIPSTLSAFFGVSEPGVYGLMLPLRRPIIYALIANAIGGLWIGLNKVVFYRLGGLGVFSIFNAISPEGELGSDF